LKLKHDELLSNFAFNLNLRHYKTVEARVFHALKQTRLIAAVG